MTRPMLVLFVSDHMYLPQRVGGTKSSTHDLVMGLRSLQHEAAVHCRLRSSDALGLRHRLLTLLRLRSRPTYDHAMGYRVFRSRRPVPTELPDVARRLDPDVIVVQAERLSRLIAAALRTPYPVIVYIRDVEFQKLEEPLPAVPRICYVANSQFVADRSRALFGIDCAVLPPLVNPQRFHCRTTRETVTFINPVPIKGSDVAFRLAEARPDIPFLFLEGWPVDAAQESERRRRADALPNLIWQQSVIDMRPIYGRTRLMLVPSQWEEGWGRVVTEAQLSGIPALASHRGGLPEAVGPGGILVAPDAPIEEWLRALSTLWDDPAAYGAYAEAAQRHAERPEAAPEALAAQFAAIAARHVQSCQGTATTVQRATAAAPGTLLSGIGRAAR